MKSLRQYLPEGFDNYAEPNDSNSPINGHEAALHPDPTMTEDGHRELEIGDPVIISGPVQFKGTTGEVDSFDSRKAFVVVNLYNHGRHSFHSSDVSYNDYADSDEEEARMYDSDPDARDWTHESADLSDLKRLSGLK